MPDPKDPAEACPVDHKSREVWLAQARAAQAAPSGSQTQTQSQSQAQAPPAAAAAPGGAPESCPVDHKSREAWMQQARSATAAIPPQQPQPRQPAPSSSWTSSLRSWLPFSSSSSPSSPQQPQRPPPGPPSLGTGRVVSTIPRASPTINTSTTTNTDSHATAATLPSNQEQETGADKATGNWVYPSERMFFEAMKRKGHDPRSADMQTVVPIHNAVNERAWAEIKAWEGPWVEGSSCGGPRLHSFAGLGGERPSPRARLNTLLGYQAPFDRHDWVVDRCGKEVEYVIDFYAGRNTSGGPQLSFYLDVRPKLNSWEGVKMRALRSLGVV